MAELYLKLKNYEKSDKVIKLALEQEKGTIFFPCCVALLRHIVTYFKNPQVKRKNARKVDIS